MAGVIQPWGRWGSAQATTTRLKSRSTVKRYRRRLRRRERDGAKRSRGMIPRSTGDHQPRWRRLTFIGNRPRR
jgi:hypothetical protein